MRPRLRQSAAKCPRPGLALVPLQGVAALLESFLVFWAQISVYAGTLLPARRQNGMKRCLLYALAIAAPLAAQSPCPDNHNSGEPRNRASIAKYGNLLWRTQAGLNGRFRIERRNPRDRRGSCQCPRPSPRADQRAHRGRSQGSCIPRFACSATPGYGSCRWTRALQGSRMGCQFRNPGSASLRAGP